MKRDVSFYSCNRRIRSLLPGGRGTTLCLDYWSCPDGTGNRCAPFVLDLGSVGGHNAEPLKTLSPDGVTGKRNVLCFHFYGRLPQLGVRAFECLPLGFEVSAHRDRLADTLGRAGDQRHSWIWRTIRPNLERWVR